MPRGVYRSELAGVLSFEHPQDSMIHRDPPGEREAYERTVHRALRVALRLVPRAEAIEAAHEVASALIQAGHASADGNEPSDALVGTAVRNRLRNAWRADRRRADAEELHAQDRPHETPAWSKPDAVVEADELSRVISAAVLDMPDAMRRVFLLIRRDERSYHDVAKQLGVSPGTVHTHLSRANARLRDAVRRYRGEPEEGTSIGDPPMVSRNR
jgi:RNA polymerase sigma factor (sigma-70 family)